MVVDKELIKKFKLKVRASGLRQKQWQILQVQIPCKELNIKYNRRSSGKN